MKNTTLWIVLGIVAVFLLGLFGGMFLPFGGNNFAFGYGCANGWNGYGMMGGRGMMPFRFIGMLFMWLIPLGVVALIVGGIFWIVRSLTQKQA
jgi:uncharacterized protein YneF (UPF0154 family)